MHMRTDTHTHTTNTQGIRSTKLLDACSETGSFESPQNSFNLQYLQDYMLDSRKDTQRSSPMTDSQYTTLNPTAYNTLVVLGLYNPSLIFTF